MKTVKISLTDLDEIREFNRITCSHHDLAAELSNGGYKVNPKSLIGLFSLDTAAKLDLTISSDNYDDYLSDISKFLVE
ncbi:MAG: hypothetical protein J1F60_10390 [Oscillospiraceae bacterium]|nr:hypothetical protein [Oscillospiraceae bacterium]